MLLSSSGVSFRGVTSRLKTSQKKGERGGEDEWVLLFVRGRKVMVLARIEMEAAGGRAKLVLPRLPGRKKSSRSGATTAMRLPLLPLPLSRPRRRWPPACPSSPSSLARPHPGVDQNGGDHDAEDNVSSRARGRSPAKRDWGSPRVLLQFLGGSAQRGRACARARVSRAIYFDGGRRDARRLFGRLVHIYVCSLLHFLSCRGARARGEYLPHIGAIATP